MKFSNISNQIKKGLQLALILATLFLNFGAGGTNTVYAAPSNDNFANAITIPGITFATTVDTTTATSQGSGDSTAADPQPVGPCTGTGNPAKQMNRGNNSVWYKYTTPPSLAQTIAVDTIGSTIPGDPTNDLDTYLAVWTGTESNLSLVTCNDDNNLGQTSQLSFLAAANTTYYFEVTSFNCYYLDSGCGVEHGGNVAFHAYITNTDVFIAGSLMGSYYVPSGSRVTPIYQGINNGPVQVKNSIGANLITSERAYRGVSDLTDFNEMMGFPANQLTTEYWFPLYDSRPTFMQTYLSIGNASTDSVNQPSANVSVYIGGQHMLDYVIPYGGRTTPIYQGINNGPVQVKSTNGVPIITSERAYRGVSDLTDFNEMMGFPANKLTTEYWFPLYDSRSTFMQTYLSIGNASTDSVNHPSANVSVYIGGQHMLDYVIPYGGRTTPIYQGINNGPVQVKSTNGVPIITSERAYRGVSDLTDFNEMMGLPASQLTTEYWFPLYDSRSTFMQTYLSIGNASTDSVNHPSASVSVYIGGQHMLDYVIPYGGRTTPIYQGINNGPVQVKSTNGVPIITSERAYRGVSDLTDFNEMMGLPASQLTTEYWFPLYDARPSFMQTYLSIGAQ